MMVTVDLLRETGARMLGTRMAARAMESAMRAASHSGIITFDTSGVRRISVSFFDEALLIFNELVAETGNSDLQLVYHTGPPTESLKNLVENRGLALSETDTGDWVITRLAEFRCSLAK